MRKAAFGLLFTLVLTALAPAAGAQDRGTPDEAKALAERAAELVRTVGPEAAIPQFNAADGPFRDRDLYVFMFDNEGRQIANGGSQNLIGRNLRDLRDVQGKVIVQEMLAVQTTGWVDYRWQNPVTHAVEPKSSYIIRIGNYLVGVGVYWP